MSDSTREPKKPDDPNTLTSQTKKFTLEEYLPVYQWSCRLTHEEEAEIYPQAKREWIELLSRLEKTQGNLIKVVGAQGVGKSTLASWLASHLGSKRTFFERMEKGNELGSFGHYEKIRDYEGVLYPEDTNRILVTDKDWEWDVEDTNTNMIIDMWDYSKGGQKDIIRALDAIQKFWSYRCSDHAITLRRHQQPKYSKDEIIVVPNIVIFLQKEALPLHFFLGKMQLFELKPYEPKELVNSYVGILGSTKPFSEEALLEIASLSRGIFRKFKEYIAACLDPYFSARMTGATREFKGEIGLQEVKEILSLDRVVRDMELTLSELFPRSRVNRELTVKLLRFLREHGSSYQKTLTEDFFAGNLMAASRLLNTLSLHGYLKATEEGRERRWSIAE